MKIKNILLSILVLMAGNTQANWFGSFYEKSTSWVSANPKASIIIATAVAAFGLYKYFKSKPSDDGMARFTGNESTNGNPGEMNYARVSVISDDHCNGGKDWLEVKTAAYCQNSSQERSFIVQRAFLNLNKRKKVKKIFVKLD